MLEQLKAAQDAIGGFRLRSFIGKKRILAEEGNVYDEKLSQERLDEVSAELLEKEYLRSRILQCIQTEPRSCKQIAEMIDVPSDEVLRQIVVLRRKNLIELDRIDGTSPLYKAAEV